MNGFWKLLGDEPGVAVTIGLALLMLHVIGYWVDRFRKTAPRDSFKVQCPIETQSAMTRLAERTEDTEKLMEKLVTVTERQTQMLAEAGIQSRLMVGLLGELKSGQKELRQNQIEIMLAQGNTGRRPRIRKGGGSDQGP